MGLENLATTLSYPRADLKHLFSHGMGVFVISAIYMKVIIGSDSEPFIQYILVGMQYNNTQC